MILNVISKIYFINEVLYKIFQSNFKSSISIKEFTIKFLNYIYNYYLNDIYK